MKTIHIINGPNLNLLGVREPEIYGTETLEDVARNLRAAFPDLDIVTSASNSEGEIIDMIQESGYAPETLGIVINPGAYAHYSIAIADAIRAVPAPVAEVHISNIFAREEFRHKDVIAPACRAIISGCGTQGYELAVRFLTAKQ